MSDQWSLEALIARYEFHPHFKEIYVEGEGDIGLYQLFLEEMGRNDVLVYPISVVSIPPDPVDELQIRQLDSGSRRSDVISLALALQVKISQEARFVTCIADADTQHIQPEDFATQFLFFTDYTSIEIYAFKASFISRITRIGSPNTQIDAEDFLGNITVILEALFSIRVANYRLGWGLQWISPTSNCHYENGVVTFDQTSFLNRYLNTKGKLAKKSEFMNEVEAVRASFALDHRKQIRGHDFIEILTWYLRKRAYRAFSKFSEEVIRHNLLSQLRRGDLASETLFKSILERYPRLGTPKLRIE